MTSRAALGACLAAGLGLAGTAASAQEVGVPAAEVRAPPSDASSAFQRDRNVSVLDREPAGYEPDQIRRGDLLISPRLSVGMDYLDNVYAVEHDEVSSGLGHAQGRLTVETDWARHDLLVFAEGGVDRYVDLSSEDSENFAVGAAGRLDVSRQTTIRAGLTYSEEPESRTALSSQSVSVRPILINTTSDYVEATQIFNRLRVQLRFNDEKYLYSQGRSSTGADVIEFDRDRNEASLITRADYSLTPDKALFISVENNWRNYEFKPPKTPLDRNSSGYEVLAGANLDLSKLIRGELGAGYLSETYADPRFRNISGFGLRGRVEWFPTQLTTVTFTADRAIRDSGLPDAASYLETLGSVRVDHELLRSLILSAEAGVGDDRFQRIDRHVLRKDFVVGATCKIGRRYRVVFQDTLLDQSSTGAARLQDFSYNRLSLTVTSLF